MSSEAPKTQLQSVLEAFAAVLRELFGRRASPSTSTEQVMAAQEEMRRMREIDEAAERAIKEKYRNAFLNWNDMNAKAIRLGVSFSMHATDYQRAAILDFIEHPNEPSLLRDKHTHLFSGMRPDGNATLSMTHPVNRAAYKISSREFPSVFPAERVNWTAHQWREHEAEPPRPSPSTTRIARAERHI